MRVGRPSSRSGTSLSIKAALREQLTFRTKANTSAASSMSSTPPVARIISGEPSGLTVSSRSVTSNVTAETGLSEVANMKRPMGSSTGSRDRDDAFV
jgi:hypothetical protein